MAAFNLTAELNLRGPSNLSQVVGNIKRQLSTVSLNLNINPSTSAGIRSITSDVNNLSVALRDAQTNATALDTALRNLGASAANVSNAAAALNTAGAAIRNVNNNANAAARGINNAGSEMAEFGRQSALAIRRFAAFSVATGGIYAVTRAISSAYGEFIKFDQEFVRLQQVTDGTASSLKGLSNEISRLSTSLGVSSQDLLNISVTLAQAGMSATETRTALEALAKSSLAPSFDDLNNTVEGSIALMRQFGIGAGDLESSLSSINSVAAKFAVEAGDIITAIQRTGGVFAASSRGVSEGKDALNEFIAVFTSVRATTRESAETIATGLRTIFTRIQRGSTISALREYGVELTDLQGKFVGPYEAVRRLSEGLKSLDPRDLKFSAIVEELGGFRQIGKVLPLIQQFATAQQALGVAQRGAGSLTADAATAQESLANKMTKVREQFVTLIRDIGKSDNFKTFVDISLKLASALISVADAAKNVLPAIAALAAIRAVPAVGQFVSGFTGGLGRRRGFAAGGLVPGSGSGDTVPAMLTPGEFVIRKNAVQAIGVGNLHSMNRYAQGGMVQKFAGGRGVKGPRGARSNFKELTPEEISKLTTKELIAYGKKLAQNIFTTGGAGMVTRMEFIPVPANRIVPELESSLKTYRGQKGFWREKISPFGRVDQAKMDKVSSQQSREVALKKQESRMADEVAARSQQWAAIRSGSPIDSHLLSALKEPILSDYKTVRAGGSLSKPFHETRLRQSVNKALDAYDDFDYSPGNIDKLVSGMAAKRFASGGMVQKFAKGQSVKKLNLSAMPNDPENYILQNLIDPGTGRYRFGIAALRSGGSKVKTFQQFNIGYGSKDNPQQAGVDLYIGALSNRPNSNISSDIESNITSSLRRTIGRTAERLAQEFGVKTISGSSRRAVLQGTTLNSAVGSVFEGALGLLGAPYVDKAESIKSMDFPFGMGENLATQFFGNGSLGRMPTDATRTFGGAGKNASDFKNQIKRFLNAVNNKEFAKLSQQKTPTSPFAKTLLGASSGMTADRRAAINSILSKYGIPANLTKRTPRSGQETISIGLSNNPSAIDEIKKLMEARASGGSIQDTVPALLTPGEFVINKSAAQRLGSSTLHRLNNADKIGGYNKGGFVGGVQHFAGGGIVQNFAFGGSVLAIFSSLANVISDLTRRMALLGRNIPSGSGWVGRGVTPLSRTGMGVNNNNQNSGMGSMALMFLGPMIAESINSSISKNFGKTGAQVGSVVNGGITGATIGSAIPGLGPYGALIGAAVGVGSALLNLESVANEYTKAQNELVIETQSSQLDKALDKLSKSATVTADDLVNIGSALGTILDKEKENRDIAVTQAKGYTGQGGIVGSIASYLSFVGSYYTGKDMTGVDKPKLTREILSSSTDSSNRTMRAIEQSLGKGASFEEVKKQFKFEDKDTRRAIAIAMDKEGGLGIARREANIADIQTKDYSNIGGEEKRKRDEEIARAALEAEINALVQQYETETTKRLELNASIADTVIQLDLFSQQVEQLGNIVNRADAEFKEAGRMRQIRTSSQLGEATIVGPSRLNEDIINNPTAYTAQALKETISNLGQTAGWTPEFTTRAENTALAAQVLQTKLPEILLREGARNANNDFSEEVRKELEQALAPIAALQGPDFKLEQFISALENSLKSEIGDSRGKSPTELAQNPEIQKLLKPLLDSLKVFGSTQKSFNDVLEATAKELNAYSGYMSRILDLQISASTIALDARNNLNKALGNPVTLSDMNSPFNTSIQALTSDFVNGRPVVGTGTLDPAEIARRLAIADENLAKVNEEKVPVAGTPQFDDYNSRLAAAKRSVDRLTKAQEKLATDATRASNALSRIQELKQAQDARKGVFTDLLGNLQNPEWIIDFENKVASLQKVMAGRGDIKDIKAAQEAFNMRIAGMDPNDRKAESDKFYGEIKDILIRRGIDPNLVNDNMRLAGLIGGPDAAMQSAIGEYNTAIQAQIEATNNMAGRMEQGSEKFYQMVVDAAKEFSNRVKEAGGIPKTDDVKVNAQEGVQLKSTGGLIYASGGKLINFQPRGTDTIPAMLTPGEFVVNARATSKNLGLLQAINGGETQKLSSGGLVYLAEGGRSDDDVQEILRKNRERIAEADKVKAMDNYDKAYQEARSSLEDNVDSLDWTYDYLDRANIDRDSTIGQFLLDKAYARYHDVVSAKVDGDEFDKENSDAFLSDRDKESAAAVVALREREKARKQAIEQAELKKKDKEAREAAAIGVGQQLAGKDRPKDMQGYLFRSADGRFDQMGDIADVTTDNKGNISVTIKKVGGDKDGSLTKPIPLGSLDNASQFVVQSYMRQKAVDDQVALQKQLEESIPVTLETDTETPVAPTLPSAQEQVKSKAATDKVMQDMVASQTNFDQNVLETTEPSNLVVIDPITNEPVESRYSRDALDKKLNDARLALETESMSTLAMTNPAEHQRRIDEARKQYNDIRQTILDVEQARQNFDGAISKKNQKGYGSGLSRTYSEEREIRRNSYEKQLQQYLNENNLTLPDDVYMSDLVEQFRVAQETGEMVKFKRDLFIAKNFDASTAATIGAGKAVLPGAIGLQAGLMTTAASAELGPFAPVVGIVAGVTASMLAGMAQEKALDVAMPETNALMQQIAEKNKIATMIGGTIGGSAGAIARQGVSAFAGSMIQRLGAGTLGTGIDAGTQYFTTGEIDPTSLGISFVVGAATPGGGPIKGSPKAGSPPSPTGSIPTPPKPPVSPPTPKAGGRRVIDPNLPLAAREVGYTGTAEQWNTSGRFDPAWTDLRKARAGAYKGDKWVAENIAEPGWEGMMRLGRLGSWVGDKSKKAYGSITTKLGELRSRTGEFFENMSSGKPEDMEARNNALDKVMKEREARKAAAEAERVQEKNAAELVSSLDEEAARKSKPKTPIAESPKPESSAVSEAAARAAETSKPTSESSSAPWQLRRRNGKPDTPVSPADAMSRKDFEQWRLFNGEKPRSEVRQAAKDAQEAAAKARSDAAEKARIDAINKAKVAEAAEKARIEAVRKAQLEKIRQESEKQAAEKARAEAAAREAAAKPVAAEEVKPLSKDEMLSQSSGRETDIYKLFGLTPGKPISLDQINSMLGRYSRFVHPDINKGIDPTLQTKLNRLAAIARDQEAMQQIARGYIQDKSGVKYKGDTQAFLDSYKGEGKFSVKTFASSAAQAQAQAQAAAKPVVVSTESKPPVAKPKVEPVAEPSVKPKSEAEANAEVREARQQAQVKPVSTPKAAASLLFGSIDPKSLNSVEQGVIDAYQSAHKAYAAKTDSDWGAISLFERTHDLLQLFGDRLSPDTRDSLLAGLKPILKKHGFATIEWSALDAIQNGVGQFDPGDHPFKARYNANQYQSERINSKNLLDLKRMPSSSDVSFRTLELSRPGLRRINDSKRVLSHPIYKPRGSLSSLQDESNVANAILRRQARDMTAMQMRNLPETPELTPSQIENASVLRSELTRLQSESGKRRGLLRRKIDHSARISEIQKELGKLERIKRKAEDKKLFEARLNDPAATGFYGNDPEWQRLLEGGIPNQFRVYGVGGNDINLPGAKEFGELRGSYRRLASGNTLGSAATNNPGNHVRGSYIPEAGTSITMNTTRYTVDKDGTIHIIGKDTTGRGGAALYHIPSADAKTLDIISKLEKLGVQKYATGGPVYASGGKLVNFQPRGTDTVPAMLTPGEFVVNAKATSKNLGLLHAINDGAKGYSSGGIVYLEDGGRVAEGFDGMSRLGDGFERLWRIRPDFGGYGELDESAKKDWIGQMFDGAVSDIQLGFTRVKSAAEKSPNKEDDSAVGSFESVVDQIITKSTEDIKKMGHKSFTEWRQPLDNAWIAFRNSLIVGSHNTGSTDRIYMLDNTSATKKEALDKELAQAQADFNKAKSRVSLDSDGIPTGEESDIADYHAADRALSEIQNIIKDFEKATKESKKPTAKPNVAPKNPQQKPATQAPQQNTGGLSIGGFNLGAIGSFLGFGQAQPQPNAADKAKELLASIPEPDYYDELTYKEYVKKLVDADPPQPPVPPDKSRFITPAAYIKTTDPVTGKTSTSRVTGLDERKNGQRTDAALADAKNTIIAKVQELENTRKQLLPSLNEVYPTEDPLKTQVDTFLSAANTLIEEAKDKGLGQQEIKEYDFDTMRTQSLEASIFREENEKASKSNSDAGVDMVDATKEKSKAGKIFGNKSAYSQYEDAVKWYIVQRGKYNYAANNTDKKEAYNKMMADRRAAYAQGKEDRRNAYLNNQRGRQQAVRMSTGGVVYAQGGMLIPYQPRGTDTVPAMLTPGEFVVNRAAAQKNIGLLKSINSGKNVAPQLFSSGGFVNVEYHSSKPNVGTPSSSSGGMPEIKVDASPLDNFGSVFNKAAEMVGSAVSEFVQGSDALKGLSAAFSSLTSGTSLLANAATSVGGASTTLAEKITSFNTSAEKLATALSSLDKMTLTLKTEPLVVSGNISVTIEGNTGNADTGKLEQSIIDKISEKVNAATNGGINIKNTA